jgi:transposase-like protein
MSLPKIYTDTNAAREHLQKLLWPQGPICPHCGSVDQSTELQGKSTRPGVFKCRECEKPFSVTVGTVFERSKIPLHTWVYATDLLTASKKGMSAHQLHRMLKVTYKTAWFMAHRIRKAMEEINPSPLGGEGKSVQADETYIGNSSKRAKGYKKGHRYKQQIVALVEPKGKARVVHVKTATAEAVREILVTNAHRSSELHTDQSNLYTKVGREFAAHKTVEHGSAGYGYYVGADGQTTNNVENFFGIFKRGMVGVYHKCEEQHLQRYLTEFEFRFNNRSGLGINDAMRAEAALKGITGKRLTYRRPDGDQEQEAVC